MESAKVIAGLTRIVRDVGMAEDLAHDALVSALEQWPSSGIPRNPAAWLMAAAKHRAIDHFRRHKMLERKHQELGHELATQQDSIPDFDATLEGSALAGAARVASVDVKDEQLSGHLQSPDFFDAERYPEIAFRTDGLALTDDGTVAGPGELTIKGVTKPVEMQGRLASAPSVDPFGRERLGLTLETAIDRCEDVANTLESIVSKNA